MSKTTDKIIAAALKVFIQKGYLQATTLEIAKEAEVAEKTLFRKYSTKQNLFLSVFQPLIERQFNSKIITFAQEEDTSEFFRKILHDRLETLSRNHQVIRVLLAESVLNHLDQEINLPVIIFTNLKQALEAHFSQKQYSVNADQCARLIGGMLLSHVILPEEKPFHELSKEVKEEIVERYVAALLKSLKLH